MAFVDAGAGGGGPWSQPTLNSSFGQQPALPVGQSFPDSSLWAQPNNVPTPTGGGGSHYLGHSFWDLGGLVPAFKSIGTGLATGVGKIIYRGGSTLEQTGYNIAADVSGAVQRATGNRDTMTQQADWGGAARELLKTEQGIGSFAVGIPLAIESLNASILPGGLRDVANRDIFQPFNRFMARGPGTVFGPGGNVGPFHLGTDVVDFKANPLMDPETAQALEGVNDKGMVPVAAETVAKQQGIGAAGVYTGAQIGMAASGAAGAAGLAAGAIDAASGASEAAATASVDAGVAADDSAWAARSARLRQFNENMMKLADVTNPMRIPNVALTGLWRGGADFFAAQRAEGFPAQTTVETPIEPNVAEPVTPDVAAVRDNMDSRDAAASAIQQMTTPPLTDLEQALRDVVAAQEGVTEHPYEEPAVPRGMTRLYNGGSGDQTMWTADRARAESYAGDFGMRHIDVPKAEAQALATEVGTPSDLAAREAGHQPVPGKDYYVPPEELQKYAVEEHQSTFTQKTTVEAPPAEVPVEPDKYNVGKNLPLTKEEIAARDEELRSNTEAARDAVRPNMYVVDEIGKRLAMPPPRWAQWLAEQMPSSWNRALGRMGGDFISNVRVRAMLQDGERAGRTAQQQARTSDLYNAGKDAAVQLLDRTMGRQSSLARVGEEIHFRLQVEGMRDMWRSEHNGFTPSSEQIAQLEARARRGYIGVTDDMLSKLSTEDRVKFQESINAAVDAYKQQAKETFQTLLASRFGAKGLEAAILDPESAIWTPEMRRLFRRAERDMLMEEKARSRIPDELSRASANAARAEAAGLRKWGVVDRLRARLGTTLQTIDDLQRGIPKIQEREGQASIASLQQAIATEGGGLIGGDGALDRPNSGIFVPLQQQFDVRAEDWGQLGDQSLHEAITQTKAPGGDTYRTSPWYSPDARLSVNVVQAPDGTHIVGTLGQYTIGEQPIQPWQAFILGSAHEQYSGFNFATQTDVPFASNAVEQAIAMHYINDVLDPRSGLNRWAKQRTLTVSGNEDINISQDEMNKEVMMNLFRDKIMQSRNPRWAQGDIFKTELAYAKGPLSLAHLAQTVMPDLGVAAHVDQAMSFLSYDDANKMLKWYYDSHNFIEELYRGKTIPFTGRDAAETMYDLIALSSVMANPTQNLGRALMALTNADDFLKSRQATLDESKKTIDEMLQMATKDPAEKAYIKDLNKPTEREVDASRAQERGVTVVSRRWLESPELREMSKGTSMVTSPKYRILDALLGRLNLEHATADDISGQPEWWLGERKLLADTNLSPEAVMHHASLLGIDSGAAYDKYVAWAQQHMDLLRNNEEGNGTTDAQVNKSLAQGSRLAKNPALRQAYENALMELHGSDALAKLRSFRDNLAFPHTSLAVTLDSIMAQLFGFEKTHWGVSGEYAKYADLIRQSASAWSEIAGREVMPHEIQALLWVYAKRYIGERDWGRLLAHASNLHDEINQMQGYVDQGKNIDVRNFNPYQDYWDQELRFSEDMLAVRGERKALRLAEKAGTITSQEAADRLEYLNNLPERRMSSAQFMTQNADGTPNIIETGIRDETYYDKKVLSTKQEQRAKFEDTYAQPIRDAVNAGDWEKAHSLVDKFAYSRKASILGQAPGDAFGPEMLKKGSAGLAAIEKLRAASYVPSPNEEALSTQELYDSFQGRTRGATIVNPNQFGRIMMRLYSTADIGTLVHEDLHALRLMLPGDEMAELSRIYPHLQDAELTPARIADEERFVNDAMQYMRQQATGGYTGPGADLFRAVSGVMGSDYENVLATIAGQSIPNEVVAYWDSIYNPDVQKPAGLEDTLRAQPGDRPLRPVRVAGETEDRFIQRVRQYGEARGQAAVLKERIRDAEGRAVQADNFARRMRGALLEPMKSEVRANMLANRAEAALTKVSAGMTDAPVERWPVQWRPIGYAIQELRDEIAKNPALAPLGEEIPQNFANVLKYAAERGFEPEYIPTMTWDMAQRYLWGHLRLDGTVEEASMRFENRGAMDRAKISDHTLSALAAGQVIAMKELIQSELARTLEESVGHTLPAEAPLPNGWRFWSPVRDAILTGRKLDGTEGTVAVGGERTIVPDSVFDTVRKYQSADPKDLPMRFLWKGPATAVWKALILTYSTTWYIRHFLSAVMLAQLEGVKWANWRTAFRQTFGDGEELPPAVAGRQFFPSFSEESGMGATGMSAPLFRHPIEAIGGELSQLPEDTGAIGKTWEGSKFVVNEINRSLKNVVKTVDGMARAAVYARALDVSGGDVGFAAYRSEEAIGNFNSLSPIERSLVTQIMPFWAFEKAMAKLLLRLPIDHPTATAIAMQVGMMNQAYVKNKLGGLLPDAYLNSIFENGKLVQLDKLNPFADSYRIMTPEGLASSLNPYLQLLGQQALGAAPFNGVPGLSQTGALQSKPDVLNSIASIYQSAVPGVGANRQLGTEMLNPTNALSSTQLASLQKRIQKDLEAFQAVKSGGYINTEFVSPKGTSGSATTSGWGSGIRSGRSAGGTWGGAHRASRIRTTSRFRTRSPRVGRVRIPHVRLPSTHIRLTSSFSHRSHHRKFL